MSRNQIADFTYHSILLCQTRLSLIPKLYIPSTLNIDLILWHTQLIVCYGDTGCGVFKQGTQNWKDFCIKINIPKEKLLNFENWTNGEPQ